MSWSLDSRYLSFAEGFGKTLVIFDAETRKIAARIESQNGGQDGIRPLTWLKNGKISFVLDGTLCVGSVANPREKIIVPDVQNKQWFNAPGGVMLNAPFWSSDGRFVVYSTGKNFIILDTATSKKTVITPVNFEKLADSAIFPVITLDRRSDDFFYLAYNGNEPLMEADRSDDEVWNLRRITMPNGEMDVYPFGADYISPNGKYVLGSQGAFQLDTGKRICHEIIKNSFYKLDVSLGVNVWLDNGETVVVPEMREGQSGMGGDLILVHLPTCTVQARIKRQQDSSGWMQISGVSMKNKCEIC